MQQDIHEVESQGDQNSECEPELGVVGRLFGGKDAVSQPREETSDLGVSWSKRGPTPRGPRGA